jgi:hypothetical protein
MAQVMALSQQEYIDSLRQKATANPHPSTTTTPSATITTSDLPLDDGPGCSSGNDSSNLGHGS